MSADILALLESDPAAGILAAADLREQRAKDVPHGPWHWEAVGKSGYPQRISNPEAMLLAECFENPDFPASVAEHIAAEANPAHALAEVALWREVTAWAVANGKTEGALFGRTLTAARAYLGEETS